MRVLERGSKCQNCRFVVPHHDSKAVNLETIVMVGKTLEKLWGFMGVPYLASKLQFFHHYNLGVIFFYFFDRKYTNISTSFCQFFDFFFQKKFSHIIVYFTKQKSNSFCQFFEVIIRKKILPRKSMLGN